MSLFLLDTTTITHVVHQHPVVLSNILAVKKPDIVGIASVNVEEVVGGWLSAIHRAKTPQSEANAARHLTDSIALMASFALIPSTPDAVVRVQLLVGLKLNIGRNDLRLAALALELGATVVTNNARDFGRVPGLHWVDWTK